MDVVTSPLELPRRPGHARPRNWLYIRASFATTPRVKSKPGSDTATALGRLSRREALKKYRFLVSQTRDSIILEATQYSRFSESQNRLGLCFAAHCLCRAYSGTDRVIRVRTGRELPEIGINAMTRTALSTSPRKVDLTGLHT